MRCAPWLTLFAVAGCGWPSTYAPDGGRNRVVCDTTVTTMPVHVLDTTGAPAPGVTVTATNSSDGRTSSAVSDGNGNVKISSGIGPGVVTIKGALNDLVTPEGQFTVTPSDCLDAVSPPNLVLQLK